MWKHPDAKWTLSYDLGERLGDTDTTAAKQGDQATIKAERSSGSFRPQHGAFRHESGVSRRLSSDQGVPSAYDHDRYQLMRRHGYGGQSYNAMERLGPTLHQVVQDRLGRPRLASSGLFFSLEEIADIGQQVITILKFIHSKHFIHGDVQPRNIAYHLSSKRILLTGVGAAQRARAATTRHSLPRQLVGTRSSSVFASHNHHQGKALSWRDDMESLGYVLVFLFRGHLPWQTRDATTDAILAMKSSIATENLCSGLQPLGEYLSSVQALSTNEIPDYDSLSRILGALAS